MIRTIRVNGFKSLHKLELHLGRINCFIGANGVGKSNVLEAIGVLGAAANGRVDDEALLRRGVRPGVPRLYKSSFRGVRTLPHIGLEADGESGAGYRVSLLNPLESPEPAWTFKTEQLIDGSSIVVSDGVRNRRNLDAKSGLAALKLVELDPVSAAAGLMSTLQQFAIYCPNTPALRGMAPDPQTRDPVGLAGGRLAEAFAELRRTVLDADVALFDGLLGLIDWVVDVQTASNVNSLLSPSVARTKEVLKFTDRYMVESRNELTAYDASEGALYVLFCAVLCLSARSPRLLAIDNLDQALNPRLLTRLIVWITEWLLRPPQMAGLNLSPQQLLFTAHNPAVLDGLDLSNDEVRLFAVDRNSMGHTSVRRLTLTPELIERNQEYPLSRLWLMGHLGAVPNV